MNTKTKSVSPNITFPLKEIKGNNVIVSFKCRCGMRHKVTLNKETNSITHTTFAWKLK